MSFTALPPELVQVSSLRYHQIPFHRMNHPLMVAGLHRSVERPMQKSALHTITASEGLIYLGHRSGREGLRTTTVNGLGCV